MHYHINALHLVLQRHGSAMSRDDARMECYGKFEEILERVFPGRFTILEKEKIRNDKEALYRRDFAPELRLVNGLNGFLQQAKAAGISMAIGTAAIKENVDFVLDGLNIRHYFNAIVSADEVEQSKPHPETFTKCALQLGRFAKDCIVFEDSPKGIEAAAAAGMVAVVITSMHKAEEFATYDNVLLTSEDFAGIWADPGFKIILNK